MKRIFHPSLHRTPHQPVECRERHGAGSTLVAALLIVGCWLTPAAHSQTLTLDSCLAMAMRNNADIRTSQMEVEQARLVKSQVFTKYFPQVQLGGLGYLAANPLISFGIDDIQSTDMREILTALYDLVSTNSDIKREISLMKSGAAGNVTLAQPIFAGGRIVTGNRLATLGIEAAELQSQVKIRDIRENIESTFYLVAGLQQKVSTVAAAVLLIDSLDHTAQVALDNGLVTRADILQVQLKRNEILAQQQQLVSGIRLAKRLLCSQIGIEYNDMLQFVDPFDAPLPELASHYGAASDTLRPEARLLQLAIEAERLQKQLTLGEALPQLALIGTAYYGNIVKTDPQANAVAFLSLSIPLTSWWETSHKLRQHRLRIEEAELRKQHYSRMLTIEEEKAYSDMVDAYLLLRTDSSALELANENYRLANLNYTAGTNTISEVLQAQALLLQAQNAITDRRTTYIMARRRLMDLRGNGE